ncbi:GIY-YIG catalytic domain protein [compost metagenome]
MPACYVLTNEATGHFYIGSSVNPKSRVFGHRYKLERGIHKNRKLQLTFTSWEHIKIEIFETDTIEEARHLEHQLIVQHHGSLLCCNQASSVFDPTQGVITNEMRLKTIQVARAAKLAMPVSDETRATMSHSHTGVKRPEAVGLAISAGKSSPVILDGIEYPSVAVAARELNINHNTIRTRIKSTSPTWAGWRFKA